MAMITHWDQHDSASTWLHNLYTFCICKHEVYIISVNTLNFNLTLVKIVLQCYLLLIDEMSKAKKKIKMGLGEKRRMLVVVIG